MKLFTLSAVILGLVALTQDTNAERELFAFTPPIEHDGISIQPRIEPQDAGKSLKDACSAGRLQLVTYTTAMNNLYKSQATCSIDLAKAKATGQNCAITKKHFVSGKGDALCGRAEVRVNTTPNGAKRITVKVVYDFTGLDKPAKVTNCLAFDPNSVPSESGMAKRWATGQHSKLYEYTCPK
ncbi:hypothetical protein BGZ96_004425 [Linnemannia gamsii]|uniref:Uncharacterized protein n=1 Tax=Linnemannia gamsii TaxID=64522 RepID=A0ABQ7JIU3_9FUNG|nr:hypothetical protein BGZ96_004425 [Linnemannia gamsii]